MDMDRDIVKTRKKINISEENLFSEFFIIQFLIQDINTRILNPARININMFSFDKGSVFFGNISTCFPQ